VIPALLLDVGVGAVEVAALIRDGGGVIVGARILVD